MASGVRLITLPAVTVAAAGTPQPVIANELLVYSLVIQSLPSNTDSQSFGDESGVTDDGGMLLPGDSVEIAVPDRARATDQFDASKIFVDSVSNGAEFRILAWIRE